MQREGNDPSAAALRALRSAHEPVAALRAGSLDGHGRRRAVLEIADSVEMALRRRLRDSEGLPLELRLKALAPDELRPDEVLAELRQHDLLRMEVAAAVHEIFEVRRRLGHDSVPEPSDEHLAAGVVQRLEVELQSSPPPARPSPEAAGLDETVAHPVPPPIRDSRTWLRIGAALAAVVVALVLVLSFGRDRGDAGLAQGIALFRSGSYADAAAYFWRYAEANPRDATPHLYLARIHRRMARPDLAAPELRTALELAPRDPDVYSELGFLLLETGRHDQAVDRFRAAIRLDPESASAWIGLVRALRESDRADAADRVLATAPERVRELFPRARADEPAVNP